jgi:reactive intermediate/imine deaminase
MQQLIQTQDAPAAIGTYSQAVKAGDTVYLSGQIPLDAETMTLVEGDMTVQATTIFNNMKAVAVAAGGGLHQIVKLTVFLTDLTELATVNEVMMRYFQMPYPARTSIQVAALPKGAAIEIDAIMVLDAHP